ncbi:hypothetical protein [Mesorhizobium sp. B2-6-2]|uniref:hypothetical protein n=1 Tax=Mesorhizobium sp. B2-6-2 TaxID=2589915 RepID=UPI001127A796|nr:hypothetical protein [Mesorhizobium sp. B2-6-2]
MDHAAHIVEAWGFVTRLLRLGIVSACNALLALRKPDATPKPAGPTQIGCHVVLIEIVHILDDLDADYIFEWEGKREELQGVSFRPSGDAKAKMTGY